MRVLQRAVISFVLLAGSLPLAFGQTFPSNAAPFQLETIAEGLDNNELKNLKVIVEALPRSNGTRHFGGRMAFDSSGYLYIAVGDRGEKDRAQETRDDAGGVHRITVDGEPAPGNPGLGNPAIRDTFYTWGNRNIQGMTAHPQTGEIWTHEHCPRIRDVRFGPDGALWLLSDARQGKLYRMAPTQ
jgi:glucose/arabinose dehydrogenase